jgi:Rps23 Pro-64 3,4-dihydroxylase Tpa1-like proline 4-hydroxylase
MPESADLPEPWRTLIEDFASIEYRRLVASVLDQPCAANIELRLVRHAAGDFLDPHTDRADKLFSHAVYFNAVWSEDWGGQMEILDGGAMTAVARVVPRLGASVLLARSESSWHRVAQVVDTAVPERRSLLIHGLVA